MVFVFIVWCMGPLHAEILQYHEMFFRRPTFQVNDEDRFALLVVDSIMGGFRVDYSGRGELADRQQKLARVMNKLQKAGGLWLKKGNVSSVVRKLWINWVYEAGKGKHDYLQDKFKLNPVSNLKSYRFIYQTQHLKSIVTTSKTNKPLGHAPQKMVEKPTRWVKSSTWPLSCPTKWWRILGRAVLSCPATPNRWEVRPRGFTWSVHFKLRIYSYNSFWAIWDTVYVCGYNLIDVKHINPSQVDRVRSHLGAFQHHSGDAAQGPRRTAHRQDLRLALLARETLGQRHGGCSCSTRVKNGC